MFIAILVCPQTYGQLSGIFHTSAFLLKLNPKPEPFAMLLMLLLLDTDGGEKKFNSLLIYSLPIKISVNINYPNHFHFVAHENWEIWLFIFPFGREGKVNWKHFLYLHMTCSCHPQWSLDTNNSHQTKQESTAAHSPSSAGPDKLQGGEEMFRMCHPSPGAALGSGLTPAPLSPGGAVPLGQTLLWLDPILLSLIFPEDFSWESPNHDPLAELCVVP